jgi:hypothetical protein
MDPPSLPAFSLRLQLDTEAWDSAWLTNRKSKVSGNKLYANQTLFFYLANFLACQ